MKDNELLILAQKISDGSATDEEIALYNHIIHTLDRKNPDWNEGEMGDKITIKEELLSRIQSQMHPPTQSKRFRKRYWIASTAAAILIAMSTALYVYHTSTQKVAETTTQFASDIQPGGNKAVLTLADGSRIVLDSIGEGEVIQYHGTKFIKTADGQLICESLNNPKESLKSLYHAFNTIETPMGGQYQVILSDGTKVWLNAASSIKYPVAFSGNERRVELTGEAYFEVAKNKSMPFKVIVDRQEIVVLGTHFNVNAYRDEASIKTTLIEGSVQVGLRNTSTTHVLKPGQQSELSGDIFKIHKVDVEEAIDWKNGYFIFNNMEVRTAMRKIAKWYDIEIAYQGNFDEIYFGGSVSRSNPLLKTLEILEATGNMHFKVEGRRITIMP